MLISTAKSGYPIFEIPLLKRCDSVYMKVDPSLFYEGDAVVLVDAIRFVRLWKRCLEDPDRELAHGNRNTWMKDYKYSYAEEGFAAGIKSPVPVADVSCYMRYFCERLKILMFGVRAEMKLWPLVPQVSIGDGMTRTIWLLANGAKHFPVKCDNNGVRLLHKYCAMHDTSIMSYQDLFESR